MPSQAIGCALRGLPEPVLNPVMGTFRRVSLPDLRPYGLPAPTAPYTQFLRTGTIPVIDYGFVSAVRRGRIRVVAAVEGIHGDLVEFADGRTARPDVVIAATGYRPRLEPLVGHLDVLDQRGKPRVSGAGTLPGAPGLHFVGFTLTLSGLLNEIARQARRVAAVVAGEPARTT